MPAAKPKLADLERIQSGLFAEVRGIAVNALRSEPPTREQAQRLVGLVADQSRMMATLLDDRLRK